MGELALSLIGTGNAFAPGGLCWNGFVANGSVLFEAPPQALMALNRLGIGVDDIETVVISHHHGDHFLGLPFLLLQWKYLGRTRPVRIVGPRDTEAIARQVCERTYPTVFDSPVAIEWVEARAGEGLQLGALRLEPVEVKHDTKLVANFGYHAELGGRRFAYTGDSALCEGVLDLARGAEVLVSECSSRADRHDTHMNLVDDMPAVRAAMGAEAELVLTHIDAGVDTGGLARTRVAEDFATYRF
ncbi:MAG: MBL fold metallo-hydrolase [Dehalococcoidia bacterium]|nr:MBL fold metallo-hydrolase [Dehalococcoidia bacterium]